MAGPEVDPRTNRPYQVGQERISEAQVLERQAGRAGFSQKPENVEMIEIVYGEFESRVRELVAADETAKRLAAILSKVATLERLAGLASAKIAQGRCA